MWIQHVGSVSGCDPACSNPAIWCWFLGATADTGSNPHAWVWPCSSPTPCTWVQLCANAILHTQSQIIQPMVLSPNPEVWQQGSGKQCFHHSPSAKFPDPWGVLALWAGSDSQARGWAPFVLCHLNITGPAGVLGCDCFTFVMWLLIWHYCTHPLNFP